MTKLLANEKWALQGVPFHKGSAGMQEVLDDRWEPFACTEDTMFFRKAVVK